MVGWHHYHAAFEAENPITETGSAFGVAEEERERDDRERQHDD